LPPALPDAFDLPVSTGYSQTPHIVALARRLEEDIRQRGLKPGDAYLDLKKSARMLGVSSSTANRALQLLTQRGALTRVQRLGTFVSAPPAATGPRALRRVFMIMHRGYLQQEGRLADGLLVGIQSQLPGAEVQFNFLPATDPAPFVHRLLGEILRAKEPAGIVITKAPYVVQRLVKDSGLPAVVHGSLYPSLSGLAWVEQDNPGIARLIAGFIRTHAVRQVCVLARETMFPGDNEVLAELGRLLGAAGFSAADFSVRHLPDDPRAIAAEIDAQIARHATDLCLVCRSDAKAEAAHQHLGTLKLRGRRRPRLIVSGVLQHTPGSAPYPCIYPTLPPEEIGAAIGRLLALQVSHPKRPPGSMVEPVALSAG
jgi:DNA-binding transcriptional regulator YhcF (GntR family)/DNA-binding LacI/PurR family transcriptional regulator